MKRLARDVALFIAGLLVAIAIASFAQKTELQLELGQCRFHVEHNGVFYQADRYTRNYLTPRCASIALAGRFGAAAGGASAWGWRAALIVTGSIATRDNLATMHDDEIGMPNLVCSGQAGDGRGCLTRHTGSGSLKGVSLGITREIALGRVKLVPEAGLLFFSSRYRNDVANVDCADCGRFPSSDDGGLADLVSALPSPMLGATLRWGKLYLALRHYESQGHRSLSLTDNTFRQIAAGIAIPL